MKKILLACACLLTLTACSMPNQHKQENKPKQNQSQSKTKEEKTKTKTFSRSVSDDSVIKVKVYYQKDKITAFSFITEKEIPDEEKGKSRKTKGIESEVRISADKKIVHQSVTLDLNKIDIDEAAAAFGVTNQEDTIFERLKDKPEDFFEAIKEQGLTEE